MAYHEIISLMQEQAKIFGLNPKSIGLQNLDPEKDLV